MRIPIQNINFGGLSDGKYQGIKNSFYRDSGIDIHGEPGIIKANQKMKKSAYLAGQFTSPVVAFVDCTNGYLYGFEQNGKIWYYNGVNWTLAYSSNLTGVMNAYEYDGYIYVANAASLRRVKVSGLAWAGIDSAYATFGKGNTSYKPMYGKNLTLYIGDGNFVSCVEQYEFSAKGTISASGTAVTGVSTDFTNEVKAGDTLTYYDMYNVPYTAVVQSVGSATALTLVSGFSTAPTAKLFKVKSTVFSPNALDLDEKYTITSFYEADTDLVIGTTVSAGSVECEIFRWNTYSSTWTNSDRVPENMISAFLPMDNSIIALCGNKGQIYSYNGQIMAQFKRIFADWTGTNSMKTYANATTMNNGLPVFGLSVDAGTPGVPAGIYSLGGYSVNYPKVLNLEYVLSPVNQSALQIYAMTTHLGVLLVSWFDGTNYGTDELDPSNRQITTNFETMMVNVSREYLKTASIKVFYRSIPPTTFVKVYTSVNYGNYTELTMTTDDIRKILESEVDIADNAILQVKVEFTSSGNYSPEIEGFEIITQP